MTPVRPGGRGKCAVCSHPDQEAINASLVAGTPSLGKLAEKYGITKTSLIRHKAAHLNPALATVRQKRIEKGVRTIVQRLEDLIAKAESFLDIAEKGRNAGQGLLAIRELRATIELLAKVTGELDERPTTVINLLTTAEWIEVRANLITALAPYPDAWRAVQDQLGQ